MSQSPSPDTSRVSPTAHYTGYTWVRYGLAPATFATPQGRLFYHVLRPLNAYYRYFSNYPNLDMMLVARHKVLDHLLTRWIEDEKVEQIIEIAAGLSPRGITFTERYPHLRYIEGDLPPMAERKRHLLAEKGFQRPHLHVEGLNALLPEGPGSLLDVAQRELDPSKKTAILTEGLATYFAHDEFEQLCRNIAQCLKQNAGGVYLSNFTLAGAANASVGARWFRKALGLFVRGQAHFHYKDHEEAIQELRRNGFSDAHIHSPQDFPSLDPACQRDHTVRILEASVSLPGETNSLM